MGGQWDSSNCAQVDPLTYTLYADPAGVGATAVHVAKFTTNRCTGEMNNFKVRAEGAVSLFDNSTYGFIGYTPSDPSSLFKPSTYDGTWHLFVNVPNSV